MSVDSSSPKKKHTFFPSEYDFDEDGVAQPDVWRINSGFHNGPECMVCGRAGCEHCHPEIYEEECHG